MKRFTIFIILIAVLCATAARSQSRSVEVEVFDVTNDSGGSTLWLIGDSGQVKTVNQDFDTSVVYDSRYWDNLTIQIKGNSMTRGNGGADSGASTWVLQQSNNKTYWTPVDSALAVDSLVYFKNLTPLHYAWSRFVVHWAAKSDSSGVRTAARVCARGLK